MTSFTPRDQFLTPSSPRLPYQSGRKPPIFHSGQRKLFFGELQFFLQYLKEDDAIVVYIGSSPGHHLNALFPLFPRLRWHNYDIRPPQYDYQGYDVTIYPRYFTDEDAHSWGVIARTNPVYFISDIRKEGKGLIYEMYRAREDHYRSLGLILTLTGVNDDFVITTAHQGARHVYDRLAAAAAIKIDNDVEEGMRDQLRWHRIMNPRNSHLKFRLPWKYQPDSTYRYANGTIWWQIYSRPTSTETRFVPQDNRGEVDWSPLVYDEQCFAHNVSRGDKSFVSYQTGEMLTFDDAAVEYLLLWYVEYRNPALTYDQVVALLGTTIPY